MNYNIIKITKIFIISIFLFSISLFANAQFNDAIQVLSFKVNPKNPKANQIVNVEIESFSVNLDRAERITWVLNGKVIARGAGLKTAQFRTGNLGSRSALDVAVESAERGTITESIVISPTEVNLLWEADSYTPPFYKGKALPASDAKITIVAMPEFINSKGRKLDTGELIFTWKRDGNALGSLSGRGKNSLEIRGPKVSSATLIQADVSSADDALLGVGEVLISAVLPKIVFYENDIIFGMKYENAIKNDFVLLNEEIKVTAHPYFFSTQERVSPDFEYKWKVDGVSVESSPNDKSSIVLRKVGAGEGRAQVSLSIQNVDKILQSAKQSFSILFGRDGEPSFNF